MKNDIFTHVVDWVLFMLLAILVIAFWPILRDKDTDEN